ncbi:MAG: hypothetical protein HWN65_21180 [Candidatus Helarchaeota archaeon]|nr:hypothetical protein [Candidatus Helarchaeota archaeon]
MPISRKIKNYLKGYLAKGVMRFMSKDKQIVYMVLNCNPKKIAPNVVLPATDYVFKQIMKHFNVKKYGKSARGKYNGSDISIVESGVGAPIAAMTMEALKRADVRCIIRVDYCGGLTEDIKIGDVILCPEAICGDGTTPHYLNPTTEYPQVTADLNLTTLIEEQLKADKIDFHVGTVWTHDALFVEPPELIEKVKKHGAIAIDMETSVIFTLGGLFNIPTAAIMVTTDNPGTGETFLEKNTMSPRIFENLDKVVDGVLSVLSAINNRS